MQCHSPRLVVGAGVEPSQAIAIGALPTQLRTELMHVICARLMIIAAIRIQRFTQLEPAAVAALVDLAFLELPAGTELN